MQRTVWNWKNLGKAAAVLLVVAVMWEVFCWAVTIDPVVSAVIGALLGMVTMLMALARWPGWRFEWTE